MNPIQNPPPRLPLVTPLENRDTGGQSDPRMVNCFAEQTATGWKAVKRAGLSFAFQGTAGAGQGLYNFNEVLYSVSADTLHANKTFTSGFGIVSNGAGPSPRVGQATVGFIGKLWQIGGTATIDGVTQTYSDVYSSLDGVSWTLVLSNAPFGQRAWSSLIVFNNRMFLLGGTILGNPTNTALGDVWSTADGVNWQLMNNFAFPPRCQMGCTIFNNKLFVAGGRALITDALGNQIGHKNDVWSSVDGTNWVLLTANSTWLPRCRFGFAAFNGKLRILGGEYSSLWQGAGSDQWSSVDGITWARDSSNPFQQGGTSLYPRAVQTSLGANYYLEPFFSNIVGGGGSGAQAQVWTTDEEDDDGNDCGGPVLGVFFSSVGSGYTAAPALSFTQGGGNPLTAYAMLQANGAVGDKRGFFAQTGNQLLFFGTMNAGTFSNEMWSSTDGTTWTLLSSTNPFGARDTSIIVFGNMWVFGGQDVNGYKNDIWSGNLSATNTFVLSPSTPGLPMSFAQTSNTITSPLLFFKSITDAYSFNPATAIVTIVSGHGNFPANTVPGVVYLDGYFFVMDTAGRIFNSSINDPTTWTALGVIVAQSEPNGGVALAKVKNYVVAFGVWSTTFFYDAAINAPASPLAPNDTLATITGCASGDSVVEMQGSVVWIGQSRKEGRGVYTMQNLAPNRISNPFVDRIIQLDDLSNVRAYATEMAGHSLYVLTLIKSNITLAYDFTNQVWSIWTSRQPAQSFAIQQLSSSNYGLVTALAENHGQSDGDPVTIFTTSVNGYNGPFNVSVVDNNTLQYRVGRKLPTTTSTASGTGTSEGYFYIKHAAQLKGVDYVQHESNGIVFQLIPTALADFGNPIDVRVTTAPWDGGTRAEKFLGVVDLLADNVESKALLRYTNDDYRTFSKYREIDLSLERQRLNNLGRFRKRAFQLRHTAATPFRAEALEFTIEQGD